MHLHRTKQHILLFFCFFTLGIAFNISAQETPQQADAPHTVAVTGYGTASATPDYAAIKIGVEHTAESATEAMELTLTSMNALLRVLDELQISEKHRKTEYLSLRPTYEKIECSEHFCAEFIGQKRIYRADNVLRVHIEKLSTLSTVLNKLTAVGANTIHSIKFRVLSQDELEATAQKKAIAHATKRAQHYAEAAGLRVGSILSMSEHFVDSNRDYSRMESIKEQVRLNAPIAEGEFSTFAAVRVVFQLLK